MDRARWVRIVPRDRQHPWVVRSGPPGQATVFAVCRACRRRQRVLNPGLRVVPEVGRMEGVLRFLELSTRDLRRGPTGA